VATFAVGPAGAKNAAVFAAQIVGAVRSEVRTAVSQLRDAGRDNVMAGDRDLTDRLAAENE
jgi:phosphoribosylcarboxyaminoimidazole (NCAIR) mutase